jgi:lipoprotein-anchoring transpeptidase ErfK/SrfK
VRAKVGAGAPAGAVFVGRRATGEICTPDEAALGTPASHGRIPISGAEVIELFDRVEPGTKVEIVA